MPRAQPGPPGPRRSAPHVVRSQSRELRAVAARAANARASATFTILSYAGGGRGRRDRAPAAVERSPRRARPVRHHRRRARLLRRARRAARPARLRMPADETGNRVAPRRAARRSSSATWSTGARTCRACCAWSMAMVAAGLGAVRAGQPRRQAAAQAARAGTCRSPTGWPRRWAARRPAGPSSAPRRPRSSTAWSATTCSTTASWWWPTPG